MEASEEFSEAVDFAEPSEDVGGRAVSFAVDVEVVVEGAVAADITGVAAKQQYFGDRTF